MLYLAFLVWFLGGTVFLYLLLAGISFYFFCYKLTNLQKFKKRSLRKFWKKPCAKVAAFVDCIFKYVHDYELHGIDKIPSKGGAIMVVYHGQTPLDCLLMVSKILLKKKRKPIIIAERFLFKIPGVFHFMHAFEFQTGTKENLIELLRKGELILIYPGGTREALYTNDNYETIWNNRQGFAKISIDSKAPIIPIFTQNIRQVHLQPEFGKQLFRRIYENYKFPLVIALGWFPVKLQTFVGEPIYYDSKRTANDLANLARDSIESLIRKHQQLPGNVIRALLDRFEIKKKFKSRFFRHYKVG